MGLEDGVFVRHANQNSNAPSLQKFEAQNGDEWIGKFLCKVWERNSEDVHHEHIQKQRSWRQYSQCTQCFDRLLHQSFPQAPNGTELLAWINFFFFFMPYMRDINVCGGEEYKPLVQVCRSLLD